MNITRNKLAIVAILFLLLLGLASVVIAQDEIMVLESSADYAYGQELRLSLLAANTGNVRRLTLSLRPELSTNIYLVDVPFEPGETISVTQTIDVNALDMRPFSDVTYIWDLQTPNGSQEIPSQSFTYEDDRFEWQAMVRNNVAAHWTGGDPALGQGILDTAELSLSRLLEQLPVAEMDPIDIYVYPSSADLRSALRLAGLEETQTEHLDLGVMLVTSVNSQTAGADLEQSVPYELARLLMFRTAGEQFDSLPWWLREGIAVSARPSPNPRQAHLLQDAVQTGQTLPLWRLCEEPQKGGDWSDLAGAQSASTVNYIYTSQPHGTIANLLSAYLQGDNCEAGVEHVLKWSLDDLENAWLASLAQPSVPERILNESGLWILLLIAGTLLTWSLVRATRKKEKR